MDRVDELFDRSPEVRVAALARLKTRYVTCDADGCRTDRQVAEQVLPLARRALAADHAELRVAGLRAIELLAADAEDTLEELARALADPVTTVRLAALDALGEFGPAAAVALAPIVACVAHGPTPEERALALDTLANVDGGAEHLDAFISALTRDVAPVQSSAANALAHWLTSDDDALRTRASAALRALR